MLVTESLLLTTFKNIQLQLLFKKLIATINSLLYTVYLF